MDDWIIWFTLFALATMVAIASWAHWSKTHDLLSPFLLSSAFFALLFVVRPIYVLIFGSLYFDLVVNSEQELNWVFLTLLLAFFCYLFFVIGYSLVKPRRPQVPAQWGMPVAEKTRLLILPGLIALAAGIAIQVSAAGGIDNFLEDKQLALTVGGTGYSWLLIQFFHIVFLVNLAAYRKGDLWQLTCVSMLALVAIGYGVVSGSKGMLFVPLLGAIVVRHYLVAAVRPSTVLALGILLVASFPLYNAYRHSPGLIAAYEFVSELDWDLAGSTMVEQVLSRFHHFEALMYVLKYTGSRFEFQLGATYLPLIFVWIPRFWWDDKPIASFGKTFADTYFGDFFLGTGTAVSSTLMGEAYVNFHIPGALLASLAGGLLAGHLYKRVPASYGMAAFSLLAAAVAVYSAMWWETTLIQVLVAVGAAIVFVSAVAKLTFVRS